MKNYKTKENVIFVSFPKRITMRQAKKYFDSIGPNFFDEAMSVDENQLYIWSNHPEAILGGAADYYQAILNHRFGYNPSGRIAPVIQLNFAKKVA